MPTTPELSTTPGELSPLSGGRVANFRLIPRIGAYCAVVSFRQALPGKLALLAVFALGLAYNHRHWGPLVFCLALITFLPDRRRILLTVSTLVFTFLVPWSGFSNPLYVATLICLTILLGALLFWSLARWPRSWDGRRAVVIFLSGFAALVAFAAETPRAS